MSAIQIGDLLTFVLGMMFGGFLYHIKMNKK